MHSRQTCDGDDGLGPTSAAFSVTISVPIGIKCGLNTPSPEVGVLSRMRGTIVVHLSVLRGVAMASDFTPASSTCSPLASATLTPNSGVGDILRRGQEVFS